MLWRLAGDEERSLSFVFLDSQRIIGLIKAYKFKLKVSKNVSLKLFHTLNLCRELYNAAFQERTEAYKLNRISISYQDQQNHLPDIKAFRADLNYVYSQVLQDSLKRLDKTFKSFFGRVKRKEKAGFPRFKG